MSITSRPIGVLGGMGPEATVYFMQQVLNAIDAEDDASHVPLLVDQNPQVPSRIAALIEGDGEDPAPVLIKMAQRLERAGAVALVMPCNTAHHYATEIANAVNIPFLNMVSLAVEKARALTGPGGAVGLLGSPALQKIGVFDQPMHQSGLSALHSSDGSALLGAIRAIKAQGPSPDTAKLLKEASLGMVDEGAQAICICCTEFSLHHHELELPVPVFDSLQCLVEATIAASLGGQLKVRGAA